MSEEDDEELVSEHFQIDELELEERASVSDYWANAFDFYLKIKSKPITSISKKMSEWLTKIEFDLNEGK